MPKRKLADVSGCKTRVVVADWALARSPKLYADLPVTLTQQKPPKKHQDYWFNFDSVLHPLALVDSEGSVVRTNEALTETITWTALTGSVTEEKFTSKPDKEGLYWFKKTDAYVLGSFAFSFSCANLSNCEPLIRYIPIIPGEGVAAEAAPSTNAISLLPRESRLEWGWMGKSAAVSLGERQLALSRYLWTSLRSDHKGSERTSFRLPPFRPSASDLLVTATLKSGAHLSRSPSDASLFCEYTCML